MSITEHPGQIEDIFSEEGPLAEYFGEGYQRRPGQVALAQKWLTAATTSTHMVGEGPTGVGKSLAYSIPAILLVKDPNVPNIRRLIIATANIALQEQLFYKDLPLLQETIFPDLTFGLLKGKNNYLCQQKYNEAQEKLFQDYELGLVEKWLHRTETGDKSELDVPLKKWHLFSSTSQECLGKKCPYKDHCFAKAAQRKARASEVIVTNFHMLLIAGGGLPAHQLLVCDEGHELPSVARSALGFTISRRNLDWMKKQLDRLGKKNLAQNFEDAMIAFENHLFQFIGKKGHRRIEYQQEVPDLEAIRKPLNTLKMLLRDERDMFKEEGNEIEEAKRERDAKRVHNILQNFDILAECDPSYVFWAEKKKSRNASSSEDKTWKKGKNKNKGRRGDEWINIECRPIDVSEMLRLMFFAPRFRDVAVDPAVAATMDPSVVEEIESKPQQMHYSTLLVSATMTSNDGFGFIREETGLTPQLGIEMSVPSPFNLREQGTLIVPETMAPQPKWGGGPKDQEYYYEALADHLQEFVNRCNGRVLALFTSWTALNTTIEKASPDISVPVLSQGDGGRTQLVERFRSMDEGLLAGVSSFWTGVDIPGMQGLFIDKLPFPVPSDPLFAAMSDLYETRGKKPFFDLSLPLATLKLRQGMGRLIRTVNDKGYAMLADRRLLDKGYGGSVIRALPDFRFIVNVEKM